MNRIRQIAGVAVLVVMSHIVGFCLGKITREHNHEIHRRIECDVQSPITIRVTQENGANVIEIDADSAGDLTSRGSK